jgi:predicted permease
MLQDIRFAIRVLLKNRAFTAVAVLSLALGIGANTAIFTLLDTILLKALPVRAPEELVALGIGSGDDPNTSFNYPDYEFIRDHNTSYSGVIACSGGGDPIAFRVADERGAGSEVVSGTMVSGNYFEVLGIPPAAGRVLAPADNLREDAHPWVVLSYDFWQRRFAGNPSAVGRAITLNGSPFNIVGVARRGFHGTAVGNSPELFLPIMMNRSVNRGVRQWNTRHYWWPNVLARVKPGVTAKTAEPELTVLWQQILNNDPEQAERISKGGEQQRKEFGVLMPASTGYSWWRRTVTQPLKVLMGVVGLVLLIACANVANLLLARAAARQKEIAIRLAVGAGRARLVRQLIVESVLVAVAGGIAGLLFAWWGISALTGLMPKRALPLDLNIAPDFRLLGFSFALSVVVGVVCGLAPALQSTRPNLLGTLKNELGGSVRRRFDLRRSLVVVQVAISLLLLIGAGLLVRSLRNLRNLDPNFSRENVLLVSVNPQASGYKGQRLRDFYDRLAGRVGSFPEVRRATVAMITPLAGRRWNGGIAVAGYLPKPKERMVVDFNAVGPGYFETLGIPIVLGRDFNEQDNPAVTPDPPQASERRPPELGPPPPVAIINEAMAQRFFPGESPVGKRFSRDDKYQSAGSFEIVGVVKNANYFGLRKKVEAMAYIPSWRDGSSEMTLAVRSRLAPERLIPAIRREVSNLDAAIPVLQTLSLEEQFDNHIAQERMVATLCGFFGGLALLLAAVGLYGVMAQSVARRVREIGIRMALGARQGEVLWLVLRESALVVGLGALVGLPAAFWLTRLVKTFLFGLTEQDPWSIAGSTFLLLAVTALAAYVPARRATKVDPMVALRYE